MANGRGRHRSPGPLPVGPLQGIQPRALGRQKKQAKETLQSSAFRGSLRDQYHQVGLMGASRQAHWGDNKIGKGTVHSSKHPQALSRGRHNRDRDINGTLTRGERQKRSSPLASYSRGSKVTNLMGRWSPYDWTHLNVDWPYQDFIKSWQGKSTFKCVHQEN